jgi:cell division protease FtsH
LSYANDNLIAQIGKKKFYYKIECSIDKIKEDTNQDETILFSVHESGHAIAYAHLFGMAPTQIVSSTSSSDTGGFIGLHQITNSHRDVCNKIVAYMAGRVAEEMVFGEEYVTSGSSGDIRKSTILASNYFRDWGMGEPCAKITNQFVEHSPPGNYEMGSTNDLIEKLIAKCKTEAKEVITENMDLFKATIDTLINDGEIKPEDFKKLAYKHGLDIKVVAPKESVLSRYGLILEDFKKQNSSSQADKKSTGRSRKPHKIALAASRKKSKN